MTPRSNSAAYMRHYRAARPEKYRRERDLNNARSRALHRLADAHPEEFDALYTAECDAAGIEPPRTKYRPLSP